MLVYSGTAYPTFVMIVIMPGCLKWSGGCEVYYFVLGVMDVS